MDLLLLHPPATKPGEPPLGPAILAGHLRAHGLQVATLDANLEACLHLLAPIRAAAAAGPAPSTAVRRALGQGERALGLLRSPAALASFPRYATALRHLDTLLGCHGSAGERVTLGDYERSALSPYIPADLAALAAGTASTLFHGYFHEVLLPRVVTLQPRLVAISINYRGQVLPAFELAGLLRRALPQVRLVAGGGMVSSWRAALRREQLHLPPFDHLVCGPGEEPLRRLACGETLEYCLDGAAVALAPDFSDAPLADYLSPLPVLPVSASRGCYWAQCRFCPEAAAPTHSYAAHGAGDFVAQLRRLGAAHGVRHFHFTDNAVPPAVLRALAVAPALPAGLRWHGFVRFERALLEPGLLPGLAASGCALLQLGLESGSQRLLERMAKGTRLEEVGAILGALREAGIASYVYAMLGIPGETGEDAAATRAFLLAHAARTGFLNLALMNLPRDAGLLADAAEHGIAAAEPVADAAPLSLYRGFASSTGWGRAEARRFLGALQREPLLRQILQRTPPWFTSNHAFFFPPRGGMC